MTSQLSGRPSDRADRLRRERAQREADERAEREAKEALHRRMADYWMATGWPLEDDA